MPISAEFIASARGRIFVLARHPAEFSGRCALVVPPFAEEMNKSRKSVTELARRLNQGGVALVIPDFFGTGDSEGDFAATDCETWLRDLDAVENWIANKGWTLDVCVAIRLGCLVVSEWLKRRGKPIRQLVLWQPIVDGARAFEQFLRLRVAASLMDDRKETVAELKAQFAQGQHVAVAGYAISPSLAKQLEQLQFAIAPTAALGGVHWFEVKRSADAAVPVPVNKTIERLRAANANVTLHTVVGEPFWASTEIVCLAELVERTAANILRAAA